MAGNFNPSQLGFLKNLAKGSPLLLGVAFLSKALWKGKFWGSILNLTELSLWFSHTFGFSVILANSCSGGRRNRSQI